MERRIAKASLLLEQSAPQHGLWKMQLRQCKRELRTLPGDALLTAACLTYHGLLDSRTRAELTADWMNRCELNNFDLDAQYVRQIRQVSLTGRLQESAVKGPGTGAGWSATATDYVHSIQRLDLPLPDPPLSHLHRGDDGSSIYETERASSVSSMHQMALYRPTHSIYDTAMMFKTELRVLDPMNDGGVNNADTESIDTSWSLKSLLDVRENYAVQEILSSFDELSDWKLQGLPSDLQSVHNALLMRTAGSTLLHRWPLLIDPDEQAAMWLRAVQRSQRNVITDNLLGKWSECVVS